MPATSIFLKGERMNELQKLWQNIKKLKNVKKAKEQQEKTTKLKAYILQNQEFLKIRERNVQQLELLKNKLTTQDFETLVNILENFANELCDVLAKSDNVHIY